MDEYVTGEYTLRYESDRDYGKIVKALMDLQIDGELLQPNLIELPYKHINCVRVRYPEEKPGLEERLQDIDKVTKVERIPVVRAQFHEE